MKVLVTFFLSLLLAFSFASIGRPQELVLKSGESWNYHFSSLDYVSTEDGAGNSTCAWFSFNAISVTPTNGIPPPAHSMLHFSLYDGEPSDGLLDSGWLLETETEWGGFLLTPVWQDLEGSISFSVDTGASVWTISNLTFSVNRSNGTTPETHSVFQTTVLAVPEPPGFCIFLASVVLWGKFRLCVWKRAIK